MSTIVESVNLHYTNGTNSDKVYNIYLEEVGTNQFTVRAYNGRRGGTLVEQPKTPTPVSYTEAKRIFDDLESKKRHSSKSPYNVVGRNTSTNSASSSTPQNTTPPRASATAATNVRSFKPTGHIAKHPKKISEKEARRLIESNEWYAQQKCDGVFMSILYRSGEVAASNKQGVGSPAPDVVAKALKELVVLAGCEVSLGLAGEYLDGALHVFNVWEKNGVQLDALTTDLRIALLEKLETIYHNQKTATGQTGPFPLRFLRTAKSRDEKIKLVEALREADAEGIIFRHAVTNTSFKLKFWEQADCLVVANQQRRSAECFVYHEGRLISLGSVTLPDEATHQEIREANSRGEKRIASVRYLYLSAPVNQGGQLVQTSFCRIRTDLVETDCTSADLKVTNKTVLAEPTMIEKSATRKRRNRVVPDLITVAPSETDVSLQRDAA